MSDYLPTETDVVFRVSDRAWIGPKSPGRIEFDKWVEAGGVLPDYVPPPTPIPQSISRLGLKRALAEQGLWDIIKAMIAADPILQEDWNLAGEIRRSDPLVQGMIAALKWSDATVDALMTRAEELVA